MLSPPRSKCRRLTATRSSSTLPPDAARTSMSVRSVGPASDVACRVQRARSRPPRASSEPARSGARGDSRGGAACGSSSRMEPRLLGRLHRELAPGLVEGRLDGEDGAAVLGAARRGSGRPKRDERARGPAARFDWRNFRDLVHVRAPGEDCGAAIDRGCGRASSSPTRRAEPNLLPAASRVAADCERSVLEGVGEALALRWRVQERRQERQRLLFGRARQLRKRRRPGPCRRPCRAPRRRRRCASCRDRFRPCTAHSRDGR